MTQTYHPAGDTDFAEAVRLLKFVTLQRAAADLGISERALKYYATGTMTPPIPVRRLLCAYVRHGIPSDRYDDFGFIR
jgi:hypothetical protein